MKKVLSIISIIAGGLVLLSVVVPVIIGAVLKAQTADSSIGIIGRAVALLGYLRYSTLKELITSIAVTGILLKVLFNTNAPMTRIVVIPFLVFAVALGM